MVAQGQNFCRVNPAVWCPISLRPPTRRAATNTDFSRPLDKQNPPHSELARMPLTEVAVSRARPFGIAPVCCIANFGLAREATGTRPTWAWQVAAVGPALHIEESGALTEILDLQSHLGPQQPELSCCRREHPHDLVPRKFGIHAAECWAGSHIRSSGYCRRRLSQLDALVRSSAACGPSSLKPAIEAAAETSNRSGCSRRGGPTHLGRDAEPDIPTRKQGRKVICHIGTPQPYSGHVLAAQLLCYQ
jgi:hypothetical protein